MIRRLLSDRDTRLLLGGQAFSILGDSALWLACGIWVRVLTGSNGAAGLTFFFFTAPTFAAPLAGMLVDRVRRRHLLIVVNALTAAMLLLLLLVHGAGDVWIIWLVMLLYGVSSTLTSAAQSALLVEIVPDDLIGDANGVLRTVREGLRLVAPLIGAGLFALVGGGVVALLDAATFLIAIVTLVVLRVKESEPTPPAEREHFFAEIAGGFRHLTRERALLAVTISLGIALLGVGLLETGVFAIVTDGLHQTAAFVGVLMCAQGAGALLGGPTAATLIRRIGEVRLTVAGLVVLAAGTLLWAVPNFPCAFGGAVLFGIGVPWVVVGPNTLLQRRTPRRLQGRVSAAVDAATTLPQTVSIAIGAALFAVLPWQPLLVAVAILCLVAVIPLLRNLRRRVADAAPNSSPLQLASAEHEAHVETALVDLPAVDGRPTAPRPH